MTKHLFIIKTHVSTFAVNLNKLNKVQWLECPHMWWENSHDCITKTGLHCQWAAHWCPCLPPKTNKMPQNKWAKQSCLKNIQNTQLKKAKNTESFREGVEIVFDHMTHWLCNPQKHIFPVRAWKMSLASYRRVSLRLWSCLLSNISA